MVKPLALVTLALAACAPVEGTVLIARGSDARADAEPGDADAGPELDADALQDAALERDADAQLGAPDAAASPDGASELRGECRIESAAQGIYDSFSGATLDAKLWLVAHGPVAFAGQRAQGGFARDNVRVQDGALVLSVRGDRYQGAVRSVDAQGNALATGRRSGAAVASRDLFGSATYQAEGRFVGPAGVELALWFVRDDDSTGAIDIGTPGRSAGQPSHAHVRMRSRGAGTSSEQQFALTQGFDDGAAHILRFDWYTTSQHAVRFWVDDEPRWLSERNLPSPRAGRLWIVAWVPDDAAADFDTAELRIENAFITPFGNDGDRCIDYELRGPFLIDP
jgi:hypothetical protein